LAIRHDGAVALMQPLEGITVVALEQAVAAPLATRHLADLGARVIKVERPGAGDFARSYDTAVNGMSSHFPWLNRSKESLTLNLKRPEAAEILSRLLARADVFVQNLAPGAAARLSLGSRQLRTRYPSLVVCNVSGYGDSGPYREKKAYDLLIQSEAGVVSITGTQDQPCRVGISVADIAAGMYAYSGILTALFCRQRTTQGTVIDVSMLEALGEWMGYPAYYAHSGSPPTRSGAHHAVIAPYGPFQSVDGTPVFLAVQNDREWEQFCRLVLERAELTADPRFDSNPKRIAHRAELHAVVNETLGRLTSSEIVTRLDDARIANARMNTVAQFVAHPQLAARNRWRTIDSPVGRLPALVPPVDLEGVEPVMGPVPALGQHTDTILAELGFEAATVAGWHASGAI
jgi:crotonobetainyl-CoA:carnitine CoA-transferase CaiB-like acyl-CoA transferase